MKKNPSVDFKLHKELSTGKKVRLFSDCSGKHDGKVCYADGNGVSLQCEGEKYPCFFWWDAIKSLVII